MITIHNDKTYDTDKATELYSGGLTAQAMSISDGICTIYQTKKGNIFAITLHWPNSFGSQKINWYFGPAGALKALKLTRQEFAACHIPGIELEEA